MRLPWRKQAAIDRDSAEAFLSFAADVLPSSWSQRFQDLFGFWENDFALDGYFIEFGAMAGRDFSNSFAMERIGWRGVVSEPHPGYHDRLMRNRTCEISTKCVLDRSGDTVTFRAVKGRPALSTVDGYGGDDERSQFREEYVEHQVETISLGDLLDESGAPDVVDYLSIDTEGSEVTILGAYDFERRPFRAISVEHNHVHRDALYELLTGQGYRRKWPELSGHDDWYVHTELELPERSADARARLVEALAKVPTFDNQLDFRSGLLAELTGASSA